MRRPTDNYILTRADAERISDVVRNAEQRIGHIKARHRRRVVASRGGGGKPNDTGIGRVFWLQVTDNTTNPMQASLQTFNGSWSTVSEGHSLYRPPTHTSNNMYRVAYRYAAVKMAEGIYMALHATPREFEIYG
jgi:hypothetical protein